MNFAVELHRPDARPVVLSLQGPFWMKQTIVREVDDLRVVVHVVGAGGPWAVDVEVQCTGVPSRCYVAVCAEQPGAETVNFDGPVTSEEIFRQSPHDPAQHNIDLARQAVPMAGLVIDGTTTILCSDNPSSCDNYTTQHIRPADGRVTVTSGDSGGRPGYRGLEVQIHYHEVTTDRPHRFRTIILRTDATTLAGRRLAVFEAVARRWSDVEAGPFYALCYGSNYMHLRCNETGHSPVWIVPGVEYSNKQYTRDAFWQSMIMPPDIDQCCYDAVYPERYRYAENAPLYLVWSMRVAEAGGTVNPERMDDALAFMEEHTRDGAFHPPAKGRPNFRSWYDLVAFDDDDCISYNQGLFTTALVAAKHLGLNPTTDPDCAAEVYRGLFNDEQGYYPLSRKKPALCVDAFAGDLLHRLLFGGHLLPTDTVARHFDLLNRVSKTDYGYKVTCAPDGSYLPGRFYGSGDFLAEAFAGTHTPGKYQWGGSWCLYDMLCLMDMVAHGIDGADEAARWRMRLEFSIDGTYHEYIDTVTGEPEKPNQGWNACVWPIWHQLVEAGLADDRFLLKLTGCSGVLSR
ncbi:MAG: hypothetical protein ACOCXX_00775 [Planctomycetota bacterium]